MLSFRPRKTRFCVIFCQQSFDCDGKFVILQVHLPVVTVMSPEGDGAGVCRGLLCPQWHTFGCSLYILQRGYLTLTVQLRRHSYSLSYRTGRCRYPVFRLCDIGMMNTNHSGTWVSVGDKRYRLILMANFNTPYNNERDGQIEFFDNFGIPYDDNSVLIDYTDGVFNGNILEFKKVTLYCLLNNNVTKICGYEKNCVALHPN